ncbi:MAG: WD40/YVTN/BNR-like repeat-containing protein, partial [Flavipsychrobacter sp.]
MKRLFTPLLAVAIICCGYLVCISHAAFEKPYYGDADAMGSDEDANARENYEWMRLHDPATGKIPGHIRERELAFAAGLPSDKDISRFSKTTSLTWQQRGPWNVGGRTRALAIDASNENILIAGSCSGGMWRSTDQGTTWTSITPADQYKSVSCLAQDTRSGHTNVWYYGTGEAFGASASATGAYYLGNGIYKSTDGGLTWSVLTATAGTSLTALDTWGDLIWNLVTDASNATQDVVYAAAYGGIYRSADGGTSWTKVAGTSTASYFTDVAITKTGVVYATLSSDGGQKGLYRSADGVTFTNITPAGFPTNYNRIKIGISPSDETQVYFLGNTPGAGQPDTNYLGAVEWNSLWRYTYVSGDGSGAGGSWQDRSSNLPSSGGLFDKFTSQGSYDLVVKVKPNDTNTVFIGGTNLYRSTSGFADNSHTAFIGGYVQGATLPVVNNYPNHHPDQHELVFLPGNPDKMISSNDGGIFKTNDNTAANVSWTSLDNGSITTMFYTCAIDHAETNDIIIGGAQ